MIGRLVALAVLGLLLAGAGLSACGGDDHDRQTRECKRCNPDIARQCFNECRELCLPNDPDCESRCSSQCDECRRDLVCSLCNGNCTGDSPRCAPQNEVVDCGDGTYGGQPATAPTPAS